ncbi:uncharacterized protein BDZ99DRAFT_504093 [Mytilinidion resinicola]|uniref:Uncharacterized protein n=1 Tax=Mytilinidion resinicola TaxID=574789 RepID=A0A6A6Y2Q3_9PEZI|nr:uncharacterized protein BDZ99DRAFT_504093 [Mytilinidion resinicola]KAF2802067.1 hypothetical protein BDZ99DRAFT_504093 [Mytilinidion resinicola]
MIRTKNLATAHGHMKLWNLQIRDCDTILALLPIRPTELFSASTSLTIPNNLLNDGFSRTLTATERDRLSTTFAQVQQLTTRKLNAVRDELSNTTLPRLLRIRELAVFLLQHLTEDERETLCPGSKDSNKEDDAGVEGHDEAQLVDVLNVILSNFSGRIDKERGGSWPTPEGAPMGMFTVFDQWQDYVEACVPKSQT